ncbi:hypothetical protein [Polynucleobacter necessarius]|uniref:hypothetical protein n=1 Tax=Polynucleobacter necessarius TaxID=576610 RepID=UPI002F91F0FD
MHLAQGRDYSDVSPIRGVIHGGRPYTRCSGHSASYQFLVFDLAEIEKPPGGGLYLSAIFSFY